MKLVVIGISHKKVPLALREKFSFRADDVGQYYARLKGFLDVKEAFILSTCNRVELYGAGLDAARVAGQLKKFLCDSHGMTADSLEG
ncbi:MAG: glutamyl-tRNA reductase, partial [Candidatus Omnitrophica bacterium]|nr:glutamyl-tRNA reductase [Candidatus Omnitrophota bacterium]